MSFITSLITAPEEEPVELQDLMYHLRLDINFATEEKLLQTYITTARKRLEQITGRAFMRQTWIYYMEDWPSNDYFKLPYPPLYSVTSVKYRDSDYTENTMDTDDYRVLTNIEPGRVALDYGATWPSETLIGNSEAIYTTFVCGYGTDVNDVPEPIRVAIMQLVAHYYEMREPTITGTILTKVPDITYTLIEPYRVSRFGL